MAILTPAWLAATPGSTPLAAQINQFHGAHTNQLLYTGKAQSSVVTTGGTLNSSNGTWLAQSFTTSVGQTTIAYVRAPISANTAVGGTNLPPLTLNLYANSAGAPTGSALVTTTITAEFANFITTNNTNVFGWYPLPISGLTASTQYWLVTTPASSGSNNFTWFRSASASGASTSPNGTAWTAQAYGFRYTVYDGNGVLPLVSTWENGGARWCLNTYNATTNTLATYSEYTVGQTSTGYTQGNRTFTYSTIYPTGVA